MGAFVGTEGGEADVALAAGAKADTRGTDHTSAIEQGFKERPRAHAVGGTHPNVRGILATVALITKTPQDFQHRLGILHVVVDSGLHLLFALRRVDSLGSTLTNIAAAVELGTLATQPQLVERYALALEGGHAHLLRYNGIAAANPRKACCLGIRAELNSTLSRTTNLVNRVRNLGVLDISLIGGIVEDKCIVLQGIVDPLAQFLLGDDRTCGVIGVAQVDDIHRPALRQLGNKAILGGGGQIAHIRPTSFLTSATAAYHHVRVDINRIDRVSHTYKVVPMQQLLKVACVALSTVVNEDLVSVEVDATRQEVVLQNGLAQEVVALLGTVAAETLGGGHLVDSPVHRLDDGRTEWLCDIANTKRYDIDLGMHHLEGIDLLGDVGEKVVVLEVQEVNVY